MATTSTTGLTSTQTDKFLLAVTEAMAKYSGLGSRHYVTETVLSQHDRYGSAPIQINSEMVGLTFFTRPRLNMTTSSLRQDPQLAMMDTLDPTSMMFGLRCNLDTVFSKSTQAASAAAISPWVNTESPFNIPLGNMLVGMAGWPDFNVEYETTEAGYFSEDMTMVRGSDRGRRTYDIQCTFRDIQGGWLMAYFYYWLHAMALQMEGNIVAYPDDREANRLNYTVSIYRFVMDPSMTTILKWAKATGCYPVSIPLGDVFNFGPGDSQIHTSQQFTIPFIANNVTYMDPRHLQAFNTLVRRYATDIQVNSWPSRGIVGKEAVHNFKGVPYVELFKGTNELMFLAKKNLLTDNTETLLKQLAAQATNINSTLIDRYTTTNSNSSTT